MNAEQKQALIDEIVIQALRDDVRQWQQRAEAAESNSNYNGGDARYWHDEYCAQQQRLVSKIVALEERLAELAKQEPVAMRYRWRPPYMKEADGSAWIGEWKYCDLGESNPSKEYERQELFTHPAPAADLAELVPDEKPVTNDKLLCDNIENNGWNLCRAAILHNIEGAK